MVGEGSGGEGRGRVRKWGKEGLGWRADARGG